MCWNSMRTLIRDRVFAKNPVRRLQCLPGPDKTLSEDRVARVPGPHTEKILRSAASGPRSSAADPAGHRHHLSV